MRKNPGRQGGASAGIADGGGIRGLQREAKAMAQLTHPNVVVVYDVGQFQGRVFISMEYVEGRTLRQWLRDRLRSWEEILAMFMEAGQGLVAAHASPGAGASTETRAGRG